MGRPNHVMMTIRCFWDLFLETSKSRSTEMILHQNWYYSINGQLSTIELLW